jgi:RNA polymerase sigma factor (sigma-70 family)
MESEPVVFIVDDDASVRKGLERLVRSVGLRGKTFASAPEFLQCAASDGPSCLVLDVRMPGVSGLALQETLAAAGQGIPIIFITGHGDIAMSVRAMKAGAVDFLPKPFNDQELLEAIQAALARDRQAREGRAARQAIQERAARLTPREREVLGLVVAGLLNKQIAAELGMSEKTVKAHRAQVMQKMRVSSVAQLVLLAEKIGLTTPQGLAPLDQSPISSMSLPYYISNRGDDGIVDQELRSDARSPLRSGLCLVQRSVPIRG